MPNIGALLKDEIRRLAKKEVRAGVSLLRRDNARLKREAADFKRRLAGVERETKRLVAEAEERMLRAPATAAEDVARARINGRAVRRIRLRLKLSQADFATLVGVTGQTVYQWERKGGRIAFRGDAKARLVAVRGIGVREARRRLQALEAKAPAEKPRRRRRRK